MPQKKYLVTLTVEERRNLAKLVSAGKRSARTLTNARILLKADQAEGGPAGITRPGVVSIARRAGLISGRQIDPSRGVRGGRTV